MPFFFRNRPGIVAEIFQKMSQMKLLNFSAWQLCINRFAIQQKNVAVEMRD